MVIKPNRGDKTEIKKNLKDRLFEIDVFLTDVLEDGSRNKGMLGKWFDRLKGYYENKFGPGWLDEYKGAWN